MSVVALSHAQLVKTRKALNAAFRAGDWTAIRSFDEVMHLQINRAFEDPRRDNDALVRELETVLHLYAQLVEAMPVDESTHWLSRDTLI